jgi:hypothetical protein
VCAVVRAGRAVTPDRIVCRWVVYPPTSLRSFTNFIGPMRRSLTLAFFAILAPLAASEGQFYSYPAFQLPQIAERDFTFAAADGGKSGTTLVAQWREGISPFSELRLDVGVADPEGRGSESRLILGGSWAYQLHDGSADVPFAMQLTAGAGGSFGDGRSLLRFPVGLSVGHRFELDGGISIMPFAHPRLSLDTCNKCSVRGRRDTNVGVDVDLGVDVRLSRVIALRAAVLLGGSDFQGQQDAVGIGLTWTPPSLR